MRDYVFPAIGDLPVADIGPAELLEILTPIWFEKPESASRVLQRIKAIFDTLSQTTVRSDLADDYFFEVIRDEDGVQLEPDQITVARALMAACAMNGMVEYGGQRIGHTARYSTRKMLAIIGAS